MHPRLVAFQGYLILPKNQLEHSFYNRLNAIKKIIMY